MRAADDADVIRITELVQLGDVASLTGFLADHPSVAAERIGDATESRTALHIATDWPGHFPRVADSIAALVAAGAPVGGRCAGPHRETALHWAASSGDLAAIDALLDAGADIEADGAVLTDGTPLADAVVFAQWDAARRLVERGAAMTLWQAAAVGELTTLTSALERRPDLAALTNACWHACRAGQLAPTRLLVERGARLDEPVHDGLTARQVGLASGHAALVAWIGQA